MPKTLPSLPFKPKQQLKPRKIALTNSLPIHKISQGQMKEVRDKELYYYYEEHISYLETTLELLENTNSMLGSKCQFGYKEVTYLGHLISEKGVSDGGP